MKKILYRNILIDCLIFFFIALISSSVIIWVFQAVNYLDLIVDEGRDYQIYFKYTLLSFPKIISKLIPFVIFFSIFYVISKYEINNELMILWNIGINKIEFVNFFLKFSFIILITQLFLTIYLVPASLEESRSIIRDSEINIEEGFFKSKKFNDTIKGLIIYVEEKDKNNFLRNVYIKKQINNNSFQITFAKQGKFISRGNDTILELYDGRTINENNGKDSYFTFSKSDFNFTNNETRIFKINKVQEIPTIDYFICLNKILNFGLKITNQINENSKYKCSIRGLKDIYEELYKRFVIPFYIPILILISQLLIIKSKEDKNYPKYKFIIFLIGVMIIIFSETTLNKINSNFLENMKLIFLPIMIILTLYFFYFYIFKLKFIKKNI